MSKKNKPISSIQTVSLPLECIVEGIPATVQSASDRRKRWMDEVTSILKKTRPPACHPIPRPIELRVKIHYYYIRDNPWDDIGFDIDNIIKPILDAGNRVIYSDDVQIIDVCAERFDLLNTKSGNALVIRNLSQKYDFIHLQYIPK